MSPRNSSLPHPKQSWAHSTCSLEQLNEALNNPSITAIEADILMGYDVTDSNKRIKPIMSHPPLDQSDLSFTSFFDMNYCNNGEKSEKNSNGNFLKIKKHIKLDFKEIETIGPALDYISQIILSQSDVDRGVIDSSGNNSEQKTIYLNADIINGPGMRYEKLPVPNDEFLNICLPFLKKHSRLKDQVCLFRIL